MAEYELKALETPTPFGRYEIMEPIGAGGMAEVFRARLPGVAGFEKQVVIKRLQSKFRDDQRFKRMFVEEAKLASQVQHKNVVQVFELGHHDGELYMVLEYVPGTDLKRLLRQASVKRLSIPMWLAIHVGVEVLEALAFAHDLRDVKGQRRNLVHCDVSPENIFLSTGGEVKLGDFGVAHDDTRSEDEFPGEVRGKLAYMAPEQLSGRSVDQRADVFSAAIVIWETLTQRRLFRGPTDDETVARICHEDRLAPSVFNSEVPARLDAALLAALRADRTRRTRTARELQRALLEVQAELRHRVALVDVERALRKILTAPAPNIGEAPTQRLDPSKIPTIESEIPSEDVSFVAPGEAASTPKVAWSTLPPSSDPNRALPDPSTRQRPLQPRRPTEAAPIPAAVTLPPTGGKVFFDHDSKPRMQAPGRRNSVPAPAPTTPRPANERSGSAVVGGDGPPPDPASVNIDTPQPGRLVYEGPPPEPEAPPPSLAAGWTAALTGSEPPRLPPGFPSVDTPLVVAPIHGGTSQVETADILRSPLAHNRPLSDRRRDAIVKVVLGHTDSDTPGVWLRRPGGAETGPRPVPDALTVLRRLLIDSPALDAQVSTDGQNWREGTVLARLLGEEVVPAVADLPNTSHAQGALEDTSLVAIFGRLSRRRQSGRLIIVLHRPGRPERYELHVHRGRLFHVASSRSLFAAWRSLLSSPQVEQPQLRAWVTQVIDQCQPFELVAAAPAVEAVRAQQAHYAQEDLQTLFSERSGRYAFAAYPSPPSPNGSGHALLTLLPSLVSRACRTSELERRLLGRLTIPMERSPDYQVEAGQLGLSHRDAAALERFVDGEPLRRALADPSDRRMRKLTLVLAYTLLELGLLRPCLTVSP